MAVLDLDSGSFANPDKSTRGRAIDLDSGSFSDDQLGEKAALVDRLYGIEAEEGRIAREKTDMAAINGDVSDFEQFLVNAGRGLTNLGRGVGMAEAETPIVKDALADLNEGEIIGDVGEIVGEAAPFLAAAPLTGAGLVGAGGRVLIPQAQSIAARALLGGAVGAAEGGIIAKGNGGSNTDTAAGAGIGGAIAGGAEVLFGVVGRAGGALFRRLGKKSKGPLLDSAGRPSSEFTKALEEAGTSFDALVDEAQDFIAKAPDGTDPTQVARKARFDSQGIPATVGDITQDFSQQAKEARLVTSADVDANALRGTRLEQSNAFSREAESIIDSLGSPDNAGDSVKSALGSSKSVRKAEKNMLYTELFDLSPESAQVPIFSDSIQAAVPSPKELRRLKRLSGSQVESMEDLLVEFGVVTDKGVVDAFEKSGGVVEPLNMGNFEEFRQAINQIERADQTGAVQVFSGPIKDALDTELDTVSAVMESIGIDDNAIAIAKKARGVTRDLKTTFSPQSIAGRLIDTKKDGVTPVIEASQVTKKLLSKGSPIEDLKRTMKILRETDGGNKAIGNLQAAAVFNALENSLKASGRKIDGDTVFSGAMFSKSLKDMGEDKLQALFAKNPSQLKKLMNLRQTGLDIQAANDAVPKGSAPVLIDLMKRGGRLPFVASVIDVATFVGKAGSDERAIKKAVNAKPDYKRTLTMLEQEYPSLAASLGVAGYLQAEDDED